MPSLENFNNTPKEKLRKDVCPGCLTYIIAEDLTKQHTDGTGNVNPYDLQCGIAPVVNGMNCPCSVCIVKMVCNESCYRIDEYTNQHKRLEFKRPLP